MLCDVCLTCSCLYILFLYLFSAHARNKLHIIDGSNNIKKKTT